MARIKPDDRARPVYYRKTGGNFEPRFTLGILYLFGFFFAYCLLLVSPVLWEVLQTVPTGPEQEEAARRAAHAAAGSRLWIAIAAAAFSTILGAHYRLLPGFRTRR